MAMSMTADESDRKLKIGENTRTGKKVVKHDYALSTMPKSKMDELKFWEKELRLYKELL